jgi:hypothetical protein
MKINPIGIVAGILILALPFLGAWWIFGVGEILILEISPFNVDVLVAGEEIKSPLFEGITRGLTLVILITGALLLMGSIFVDRWWGVKFIRFGSYRILNLVISLLIVSVIILPALGSKINPMTNLPVEFSIPIQGEEVIRFRQEGMSLSVGVQSKFTPVFFFAILTAILAVYSRVYMNKMLRRMKEEEEAK